MVVPTIGREGEASWWPWNLTVTQDQRTFSINLSNAIIGLSRAFYGRILSTMDGLILLPGEVDVSRPFQIGYSTAKVPLGPFGV